MKRIDYKYLKKYIMSLNFEYRVIDIKRKLEYMECYFEYYPKEEYPSYFEQYDLSLKEVKKLIKLCDRIRLGSDK